MALCFFAVIILAFFTGIAIGYILFEFYVMTRKDINFYFVEGDEVNNFLEEIRRSKDNGARMLNYDINNKNNSGTISQTISSGRNRPRSLSSILRGDNGESAFAGSVSHETEQNTNILNNEDLNEENLNVSRIENDNMENLTDENDDFIPDDDFLKKYYRDDYDEAEESVVENISDGNIDDELSEYDDIVKDEEDTSIQNNDDIQTEEVNAQESDNCVFDEEMMFKDSDEYTDDMLADLMDESNISTIEETDEQITENDTVTNEIEKKELKPEELNPKDTSKQDKIESNVCIQLGGSTTSVGIGINSSSGSFVSIPLTMTEKPVEPDAPPKRKRGRPRKNKK